MVSGYVGSRKLEFEEGVQGTRDINGTAYKYSTLFSILNSELPVLRIQV